MTAPPTRLKGSGNSRLYLFSVLYLVAILFVLCQLSHLIGNLGTYFAVTRSPSSPLVRDKGVVVIVEHDVEIWENKTKSSDSRNRDPSCRLAEIEPFNKDVQSFYGRVYEDCEKIYNKNSTFKGIAFTVKHGNQLHRLVDMDMNCCFKSFFLEDDHHVGHLEKCHPITSNVTRIPGNFEFIKVLCRKQNGTLLYRDAFPLAHDKIKKVSKFKRTFKDTPPLNVIILGLDAVSRLNFLRQMPLSSDYLLQKLDAISLEGYSVVGHGTLKNALPLLTGMSFANFSRECAEKHKHLDNCPFIWHNFSQRGYLTNFADDWTTFNEYWPNAFNNSPTDYYFRAYLVHMARFHPALTPAHFCFGPRLAFEVMLNFVEQVREKATKLKRPNFQFTHSGRLAHDYMNHLGLGDVPLLTHLMRFQDSPERNKTVLLVLGDHGYMQGYYFMRKSGRIEYTLPVAYIVLPPWFKTRYPEKWNNLRGNVKQMTTPYDIHETLLDLLDMDRKRQKSTGISLFEPIPENRKCVEAGISLKWCRLCHKNIPLPVYDPKVKIVTSYLIESMNAMIKNTSLCTLQTLDKVTKAHKWNPKDVFNELCNVGGEVDVGSAWDPTTRKLNASCDENLSIVNIVNVQFTTSPQGAIYQGEVMIIGEKGSKKKTLLLTDQLTRLDRYTASGHCVPKPLKPYCICEEQITTGKLGKS